MSASYLFKIGSLCLLIGVLMNKNIIIDELHANPVIIAIKNNRDLTKALESNNKIVFVLYGNIDNISVIIDKLKDSGKIVIVHEDLIEGLSSTSWSNNFIIKYTNADGIITTRSQNAYEAKKMGLFSVLRFFAIDSMSYDSIIESVKKANCDLIEILPGIMPRIIESIYKRTSIPIVAGGLIRDKKEVMEALNAGALAISTSSEEVWKM